jgi:hypothetical protein
LLTDLCDANEANQLLMLHRIDNLWMFRHFSYVGRCKAVRVI